MGRKAAFLDRDGTIITEAGALAADPGIDPLPEAIPAIRKLRAAGFLIVVVTNQSGIARGYYTEEELGVAHEALLGKFADHDAAVDAVYYCPHLPEGEIARYATECDCRKPKPGMLLRAAEELDIDLGSSYLVGDAERDIEAGRAAGCKGTALIRRDAQAPFTIDPGPTTQWQRISQQMNEAAESAADAIVPDVNAAADWILDVEKMNG